MRPSSPTEPPDHESPPTTSSPDHPVVPVAAAGQREPSGGPPPRAEGEPEAIFIVGVPRSGTTLMRMVFGRHSRIAIADENHYLGHFLPWVDPGWDFRRVGDLHSDDAVRRLVDRIYSDEFQGGTWLRGTSQFWQWLLRHVPPEELEQRLLAGERSRRGVFTTIMRVYADRRNKAIMGEKTPAHYRHVDTLLEWYPTARVVHMVRDPRAVYLSELRRRTARPESVPYRWLVRVPVLMEAFVLFAVTRTWADAVHRHRRYSRRYRDRYRLVRFEDLVREPEAEIRELCTFLGVPFEPRMLRQKVVSRGQRLGEAGFDAGAADRWRTSIRERDARALTWLLGRRISEMGYPRT
jgi:hypothetical protein